MRVNMNMPEELVARLDAYADENYCSRSSAMCQACNQFLLSHEMQTMFSQMGRVLQKLANSDAEINSDTLKQLEQLKLMCDAFSESLKKFP